MSRENKETPTEFLVSFWLGKIKQALIIYEEDIRNRLEEYNPEK